MYIKIKSKIGIRKVFIGIVIVSEKHSSLFCYTNSVEEKKFSARTPDQQVPVSGTSLLRHQGHQQGQHWHLG
jgi:hypothetical protein